MPKSETALLELVEVKTPSCNVTGGDSGVRLQFGGIAITPVFLNLFVLIRRVRTDRAIDEFYHPYTAGKFGGKCRQLLYDTRGSFYLDGNPERQFDPEALKRAEERLDESRWRKPPQTRKTESSQPSVFFLHSFPRRVIFRRRDLKPGGNPMKLWGFALLSVLTVCASADDLTTKSGTVYKDYSINGPSVDGLVIFHELGGATVPYAELPDDLRTKYKAEEEKAAATLKEREEQRKKLEEQRKEAAKRQAEDRARREAEKLEEERLKEQQKIEKRNISGIEGYKLGDVLDKKDVASRGASVYWDTVVKLNSKNPIPGGKLEVATTEHRNFIKGMRFHASNYSGSNSSSDAAPIFFLAQELLKRYPEIKRADEKFYGDYPIQGKYEFSYEGRTVKMDFSISNFQVIDDKSITGRASITIYFSDSVISSLDSIFQYMAREDLFTSQKILERINKEHPEQKGKPVYEEAKALIDAKVAEIERIAKEKKEAAEQAAREIEENPIEERYDQMQKITWHSSRRDCSWSKSYTVKPYIGVYKDGRIVLRLKTEYDGSSWIFYEKVQLLGDNDAEIFVHTDYPEKKSDSGSWGVLEWSDDNVSKLSTEMSKMAEAQTIYVKFYGKYSKEFEMTDQQLKAFKEIMKKYAELNK